MSGCDGLSPRATVQKILTVEEKEVPGVGISNWLRDVRNLSLAEEQSPVHTQYNPPEL